MVIQCPQIDAIIHIKSRGNICQTLKGAFYGNTVPLNRQGPRDFCVTLEGSFNGNTGFLNRQRALVISI